MGIPGTHYGFTGDKIKALRSKGYTYNQIKEELGCSKATISYHLNASSKEKNRIRNKKNKVAAKQEKPSSKFMSDKEIQERIKSLK